MEKKPDPPCSSAPLRPSSALHMLLAMRTPNTKDRRPRNGEAAAQRQWPGAFAARRYFFYLTFFIFVCVRHAAHFFGLHRLLQLNAVSQLLSMNPMRSTVPVAAGTALQPQAQQVQGGGLGRSTRISCRLTRDGGPFAPACSTCSTSSTCSRCSRNQGC
jgi:hypothetical protein